jgi:class 3 adenylate cyclase
MRELPTGTVTFLFTDIEGSTRLLHELGDGYAEALGEHRRLLREAFASHGGVEVDTLRRYAWVGSGPKAASCGLGGLGGTRVSCPVGLVTRSG